MGHVPLAISKGENIPLKSNISLERSLQLFHFMVSHKFESSPNQRTYSEVWQCFLMDFIRNLRSPLCKHKVSFFSQDLHGYRSNFDWTRMRRRVIVIFHDRLTKLEEWKGCLVDYVFKKEKKMTLV